MRTTDSSSLGAFARPGRDVKSRLGPERRMLLADAGQSAVEGVLG